MDNNINNTKTSYVSQFSAPMRINKFSMLNEGNNQQLILDDIRQSFIGQDQDQVHQIDNRLSENSDQQGQKNTTIEQNEEQFSIRQIFFEFYDNLIDIKNNPDLVKNTFVWVISFSCGIFSYTTCTLVLDQLEGNLYINSIGFSLLELLGGILSGWIIFLGWNLKKTLQVNFFFQGLIYLITMVFINTQVKAENFIQTLLSIAPILVAKLSFELIWTLLMTYLRDIMYVKYQLFVVSIAQVFSKVLNCIIPFYMYFAESMGINKFLLCTVLCLYCAYLSRNYKKTQDIQFVRKAQNDNANLIEMCEFILYFVQLNMQGPGQNHSNPTTLISQSK
ncbi:Major facilitator superfamily domain, general substrate transporter [Pseudocohnilembus persalinus]|uniref:Major facilitator superfamily domain, general substrate transporter n=1 Tax=Pseudocohnilembus persalinus TaxID=266149 RepID=A0A0V0R7E8_PSEPJ|nr:Major facilitator superfamily domain, general substrate transporter [Pseudocohnilembus persalinus]|eukprot:KRX10438.1 Major facilitator superfamily domain, general substrate transporter [Pseudocohnilembus persalinus]